MESTGAKPMSEQYCPNLFCFHSSERNSAILSLISNQRAAFNPLAFCEYIQELFNEGKADESTLSPKFWNNHLRAALRSKLSIVLPK